MSETTTDAAARASRVGPAAGDPAPPEHGPLGPHARRVRRSLNGDHPGEIGTMLPPFIDHHVHLQLGDADAWVRGGLAGVVDLGGNPATVAVAAEARHLPHVRYAGAFLTATGGYPLGRPWCPAGAVREIPSVAGETAASHAHDALPGAVTAVVDEQRRFGASVIKVALDSTTGPVFDLPTLRAIVGAGHGANLPVAVHAEGVGMAALALDGGADVLVHAPWSEPLDDGLVRRAASARQAWISTLAIHVRDDADAAAVAIDNVRRFHEAGGRVLYGTDLGNGPLTEGVNATELAALGRAGLAPSDLVAALIDPWPSVPKPSDPVIDGVATFVPGEVPDASDPDAVAAWLAGGRIVPTEELEQV